ncbi:phosphocholine cytidylyltransferase/choline kinase family protein [Bacillus tuaregi]|uniref:phosphocholine cytidylyltransferase/choline kinase family protein n=1 Tax=Bacillus tuaregi TaxID=1816695 RepID=UPI0008F8CBC3|nr:phosphocholine cytidylyltransferase/choline kinase family protein [Bacillus tuaregi]
MEHLLRIMEVINKNNNVSQKKIADLTGLSIGKVNYLINDLILQGFVFSEKTGRNISYYITEDGIEFLKSGYESFKEKKINIHQQSYKEINTVVILAAGKRKDFDHPAGLLQVDGQPLLRRNLELLEKNGISKFIIVTGFEKDALVQELADFPHLEFVENPKYKWTGSMASLACAEELITDDFLLFEEDILIEESAVQQLITHPQRDCMLIASETGSGDEAFVEIKDGYLHKISKDIHQFNRVDGEMLGISKISLEVFTEMVKEFKENNQNPYMNYEYMLLDVARHYHIGYLKIHNLVWAEMDTKQQYEHVMKQVYPILKRKEAEYREHQIKLQLVEAMQVSIEDIQKIEPFGGMTNKNFKVMVKDEEYVLRLPGNGTEKMINRMEEKRNSSLASSLGIDAELIYFNEETGVKVSKLIANAETLNPTTAKREDNMRLTTSVLKKLHHSGIEMNNQFDVFAKMAEYEQLLEEVNGRMYEPYEEVKSQVMALKHQYELMDFQLMPSHNDLVAENFVKSGEDKIYLIDWEYGGMNDPVFDLAAHSLECEFSEEDEELFLRLYLDEDEIPVDIQKRMLMNKIFQDFLWSIWTCIKEAKGDDFGTYGIDRFNRARAFLTNPLIKEHVQYVKK